MAAAAALEETWRALRPKDPVECIDLLKFFSPLHRKIHADGYVKLVEHAPDFWGMLFKKTDNPKLARRLNQLKRLFPSNSRKRFKHYLRTIFDYDRKICKLPPLLAMNPMGKDHVTALLDAYLAMDADAIGARVAAEAAAQLADVPGDFKIGLVTCDDLMGVGSNRYDLEFAFRIGGAHLSSLGSPRERPRWLKDWWLQGVLWSSEPPSERAVREAILTAVYRVAYMHQHGLARTLREMLTQEGQVMALAGCSGPTLDAEDIAYTREVLIPYLDADDKRTCIECLFGDAAARTLGFTPRGLSPWAGLALALHDAGRKGPLRPTGPASRRSVARRSRRRPGG